MWISKIILFLAAIAGMVAYWYFLPYLLFLGLISATSIGSIIGYAIGFIVFFIIGLPLTFIGVLFAGALIFD